MNFLKRRWRSYSLCMMMFLSFNLYFIFLMRDKHIEYLIYLDFLLLLAVFFFVGVDCLQFYQTESVKKRLVQQGELICEVISRFENKDIAEHDIQVLNEKLQEQFNENCELQDFVAKWCHEFKIPLSACLLMNEKIEDIKLRKSMREQLERMNRQVRSMMLGCKLQSALFDLQIRRVSLLECVKASIRNNQFFLIQKGFELEVQADNLYIYTDPSWFVYILDQLLDNAIKYAKKENPRLHIWTEQEGRSVRLFLEDFGEGILSSDIRRIFDKGFTGSNYHNGKYKSTGMGLYMVSKIIDRMGCQISVESEYGVYTRFTIIQPFAS